MTIQELTRIINIVTPKVYNAYMREITAELSAFVQSGIAVADERVSRNITAGGLVVNMPFWNDLSGDEETLDDGERALSTGKIEASRDMAAVHYRGRGWKVNELAAVVSGDDPLGALMARLAAWQLRQEQKMLFSTLNGIFAAGGALRNTHFFNASNRNISAEVILDAKQLLGDAAGRLSVIGMHSATRTELQKQNLIKSIPNARGEIAFEQYLDYRVVVDDGVPHNSVTGVYRSYLFGTGSIGRSSGNPEHLTTFETNREAAKGNNAIYTRRADTMHPYGVKWLDVIREPNNITPTNRDLEDPRNWRLVYEPKNVALVAIDHRVGETVGLQAPVQSAALVAPVAPVVEPDEEILNIPESSPEASPEVTPEVETAKKKKGK
jgi:hypothetical protein